MHESVTRMAIKLRRSFLKKLFIAVIILAYTSIVWIVFVSMNTNGTQIPEHLENTTVQKHTGSDPKTLSDFISPDATNKNEHNLRRTLRSSRKRSSRDPGLTTETISTSTIQMTSLTNLENGTSTGRPTKIYRHRSEFDEYFYPEQSRLGSISDFKFMINRDLCGSDPIDMMILVGTHPNHKLVRQILRDTWGAPRVDDYIVRMAFFIGKPEDARVQRKILDESTAEGDVIQGNFKDHYHNITHRDLMAFRWAWRYCPQARFFMRTDDDVVIDIDGIIQALEVQMPKDKEYLACINVFQYMPVLRSGGYSLDRDTHPEDYYEPYCHGWTYWLTTGACKAFDDTALKVTPYWMNDAYLTGTVMSALGWAHRMLAVPYTNNGLEMMEILEYPISARHPYSIGPSVNIEKTKLLHRRFSARAQLEGVPKKGLQGPTKDPYYPEINAFFSQKKRMTPRFPSVTKKPNVSSEIPDQTSAESSIVHELPVTQWVVVPPLQPFVTSKVNFETILDPEQHVPNPQQSVPNPQEPVVNPQTTVINSQELVVTPQPVPKPQQPVPNHQHPVPNPQQPIPNHKHPILNTHEPAINPQTVPNSQELVFNPQPVPNPQQPVPNPKQPVPNPKQPVPNPKQPVLNAHEPALKPQTTATSSQELVFNPKQPAINPKQPAINPKQPTINPKQPYMNPKQPAINPKQPYINPKQHGLNPQPILNPQ